MKKHILTAVSVLAIMAAAPVAFAADDTNSKTEHGTNTLNTNHAKGQRQAGAVTKEELKQNWNDAKHNVKENTSNTADDLSNAAHEAYEDVKAAFIDEDADAKPVTFNTRISASGMLGKPVYNNAGERIAKVKDIILDKDGTAQLVILSEGGVFGIGNKLAAFDYGLVSKRAKDGDVIMPLSEKTIKQVKEFSYEAKDQNANTRVLPAGGVSVAKLLEADLIDPSREDVASVDNLTFRNGEASQLIVAFDETLGMGGEKAALDYDDLTLVRDGDDYDVQLSAKQAQRFETYKTNANR